MSNWGALAIFLVVSLIYLLDVVLLGPDAPIRVHDTFDSEAPRFVALAQYLKSYGLVQWYPIIGGGMPVNAFHFTQLYPLVLLSTQLPLWLTASLLLVLLTVVSGYGVYRLLHEFFDLPTGSALLGGLFFLLIAPINHIIFLTFVFIFPLVFVLLHSPTYERSWRQWALRAVPLLALTSLSYPILALPFFPFMHGVLLLAYFAWQRRFVAKMLLPMFLYWIGYVLIFVPNLFELLDYLPSAHRAYANDGFQTHAELIAYLLGPFPLHLLTETVTTAANLFLLPLLVAGLVILPFCQRTRIVFVVLLAILLPSMAFIDPKIVASLPGFMHRMDVGHFFWCLPLALTLFVSVALHGVFVAPPKAKQLFLLLGVLTMAVVAWNQPKLYQSYFNKNILAALMSLLLLLTALWFVRLGSPLLWRSHIPMFNRPLLNGMVLLALLYGALTLSQELRATRLTGTYNQYFQTDPVLSALAQQQAPLRVVGARVLPAQLQAAGLETLDGRSPLFNRFFKEYVREIIAPQLDTPEKQAYYNNYWYDLNLTSDARSRSVERSQWREPPLAAMNVRYIVSSVPISGLESAVDALGLPPDRGGSPLYVYAVPGALPRGYLVPTVETVADRATALARIGAATLADFQQRALVVKEDLPATFSSSSTTDQAPACGSVVKLDYRPDRLRFDVNTTAPCYLVVSNNYDPKWQASVDGHSTSLVRANHAFQMVSIPDPGSHRVELRFLSNSLFLLASIPVGMVVILFAGGYRLPFRRRKT